MINRNLLSLCSPFVFRPHNLLLLLKLNPLNLNLNKHAILCKSGFNLVNYSRSYSVIKIINAQKSHSMMKQGSLLSFFKPKIVANGISTSSSDNENADNEKSPVKNDVQDPFIDDNLESTSIKKKRKRCAILESESENEDALVKCGESGSNSLEPKKKSKKKAKTSSSVNKKTTTKTTKCLTKMNEKNGKKIANAKKRAALDSESDNEVSKKTEFKLEKPNLKTEEEGSSTIQSKTGEDDKDAINETNGKSPGKKSKKVSTTPKSEDKRKKPEKDTSLPPDMGKLSQILKRPKKKLKKGNPLISTTNKVDLVLEKQIDASEGEDVKTVSGSNPEREFEEVSGEPDGTKKVKEKMKSLLIEADKSETNTVTWNRGSKTLYLNLAKTLEKVEATSSRLKIIDILANYFRNVIMTNKEDLLPSIYLCLNTLGPAYDNTELGIADTYLMKAIVQCTGRTLAQIKKSVNEVGDLGIVAEQSRSNQRIMHRPAHLTVQNVFSQLTDISKMAGKSAMQKKIDKIQTLFVACRECEARFIIRTLAGKLRIGLAEQSVLQALALACTMTPPNQEYPFEIENLSKTVSADEFKRRCDEDLLILKTTYCECPNFNLIIPVLLVEGMKELPNKCKITPGIPVKPMLAQPTKGVQEVLQRFDNIKFTCEWKYDGERAQIHVLEDKTVKIYSRNQEDNTSKYPDIIADVSKVFKEEVKSCILDAEAVAWDREKKKIMPFQVLSTRKRKDADVSSIKVQVCVFLFDLLYLNGESLTTKSLEDRRKLLKQHAQEIDDKFSFVTSIDTNTLEEMQEFLEESVKGNCEGLMVKTLDIDATYEIAKRSRNWLKLKKDYLDGCGDTLDLVVIGAYTGKGKRTGQYGGFLLASYDTENDEYQTICKIGTGFTEESLSTHSEFLKKHEIPKAKTYYRYDSSHPPDVWFDAVQVWEVKCADLSLSPVYFAGIGIVDDGKGISLRFPRFVRIRDDKKVEEATSAQQVADMYLNQDQIKNNAEDNNKFEEDSS